VKKRVAGFSHDFDVKKMKAYAKEKKITMNEYITEMVGNTFHEYLSQFKDVPVPE